MIHLVLPSGDTVYDGALLKFNEDSTNYFLHYGNYSYQNKERCGWYVQAIGSTIAVPITDELLGEAIILNNGAEIVVPKSCSRCTDLDIHPPFCDEEKFTSEDKYTLDRTWITVDTIAERDALPINSILNGRVVQVNQSEDDRIRYYRFNIKTMEWDEILLNNINIEELLEAIDNISSDVDDIAVALSLLEQDLGKCKQDVEDLKRLEGEVSDVKDELHQVFQSVSDFKSEIASAITDMGVPTDATADKNTMAENIRAISSGGSSVFGIKVEKFTDTYTIEQV